MAGGADQDRDIAELNWKFAADAVGEVIKFLPDGADVVPDEAVWSDLGRQSRARNPELVTRAKLTDDLEYYQGTLADSRARRGESL